jgi:hypothetical protein
MLRFVTILGLIVAAGAAGGTAKALDGSQTTQTAGAHEPLIVPSGTQVPLLVTRPVRAQHAQMQGARVQDALFAQTSFPVAIGGRMAIPAGTYVEGEILSLTQPTRKVSQSKMRVRFTGLVFANGYTVPLGHDGSDADTMDVTVQVSTANDLLLDNGVQMEMTLTTPVTLSGKSVRGAIPLSKPPKPGSLASATVCRPTAGTPGSPDTVIPGSPGTPDTVIPGLNGMPDTVIPGTPSTPDSVIPGNPGSPGTVCPAQPRVISSVPVAAVTAAPGQAVSAQ